MSLIPVDAEYHYVQDTAPSSANAGDVWLDTSQNPPVAKIYADVGNGIEWLQDQSSDRIATNLDAPVSEAGQGVDWGSKTPQYVNGAGDGNVGEMINVTGSGYIQSIQATSGNGGEFSISIDGTNVTGNINLDDSTMALQGGNGELWQSNSIFRFTQSFTITDESGGFHGVNVTYVLD